VLIIVLFHLMKFILKGPFKKNIYSLMRKIGYSFQRKDEEKSELIFIRPLERSGYPRFHVYLKIDNENLIFNLHLDQKRPSYKGSSSHAGEHKGEVVGAEEKRIKETLKI